MTLIMHNDIFIILRLYYTNTLPILLFKKNLLEGIIYIHDSLFEIVNKS